MQKRAILVGLLLAAMTTLSVPMAANADSEAPASTCSLSPSTVAPGGASDFSGLSGTFGPSEQVHVVITGHNASAAGLESATGTTTTSSAGSASMDLVASASGAVSIDVAAPANGSGAYQLSATGMTSGDVCTATLTVYDPSSPSGPSDPGGTTGSGLADTGSVVSTTLVWAAGGIVALGALLLASVSIIRRRTTGSRR